MSKSDETVEVSFNYLWQVASENITDDALPGTLISMSHALNQMEALLAVSLTGAETSDHPWKNSELVEALESLIKVGRTVEQLPVQLVDQFLDLVRIDPDNRYGGSLHTISRWCLSEGNNAAAQITETQLVTVVQGQEMLLKGARGTIDTWASKRLQKNVTKLPNPALATRFSRKLGIDLLEEGQALLSQSLELMADIESVNDGREIALNVQEKDDLDNLEVIEEEVESVDEDGNFFVFEGATY